MFNQRGNIESIPTIGGGDFILFIVIELSMTILIKLQCGVMVDGHLEFGHFGLMDVGL